MAVEVDSLQIKIKADARTASNALDALRKSLASLSEAVGNGKGLKGITKLADSLSALGEAKKNVRAFSTGVKSMTDTMDNSVKSMNKFNAAVMDTVMMAGTAAGQMRDIGLSTEQLTQTANAAAMVELTEALNNLSEKMGKTDEKAKKTVSTMKQLEKVAKPISKAFSKIISPITNFISSLKRIAFYRFIRTVLKNITAAVKEGLTNLEAYSREVGTEFAPAVDNLRQHILLLKNSFATALRPVIEAILPTIIQLVDWFSKLADFAAQVFSVLTGKVDNNGRYTKAVLSDLEQSNKQAKELRRTLLGFDEINRLDGDTGSGEQQSAGLMFTQADVSDKAVTTAEKIKEIFGKIKDFVKSIDWATVGKVVAAIAGIVAGAKIATGVSKVVGFVKSLFEIVKKIWPVITSIVKAIGPVGGIVIAIVAAFAIWGDKIAAFFNNLQVKGNKVFDWIDEKLQFSKGLTAINEFQRTIFNLVTETIGTVASMVYKLFHGDFKGALKDLVHLVATIIKGIIQLVVGFANIFLGIVDDIIYYAKIAAQFIWNKAIVPVVNAVATVFAKIKVAVHNAVVDLKIGIQKVIKWILEKVNDLLLGPLQKTINSAIVTWNDIFGTDLKPISLTIDTTKFDEKVEELEKTKLPPITETVQLAAEWTNKIERLGLEIDATGLYNAIDTVERKLNNAIDGIGRKIATIGGGSGGTGNRDFTKTYATAFASGGFPSAGSLFIAGEAGPELVANFGGQTGVWNSDQMAQALYNAVSAALAANPQGGDIYLDGEVIYRNTVRRNNNQVRSTGRSALLT